jgi:hypothetical protein
MRAFPFRVELDRLAGIQRPFHPDVSMHQRPSIFRGHYHGLSRSLPMWLALLRLGQLQDELCCILERDDRLALGRDRIDEAPAPGAPTDSPSPRPASCPNRNLAGRPRPACRCLCI